MAAALAAVWRAFGEVPAALAFTFLSLSFFARFDYIGGSLLRWDWIAMLLIGVARASPAARAGWPDFCCGYAALARLFPTLFLVPLAVKRLQGRWRGQPDATRTRCLGHRDRPAARRRRRAHAYGPARAVSSLSDFVTAIGVHQQGPAVNAVGLRLGASSSTARRGRVNLDGTVSVSPYAAFAACPAA